jgi:hypothetical protein
MNNDATTLITKYMTKYLIEAIPKTIPNINLMPTTANEIKIIINTLKLKTVHYDEISTVLLKGCSDYISFP